MKISKLKSAIFWSIAIILLLISCKIEIFIDGNLSALKAHEKSERTYHYGPSEVIETRDLAKCRIYLCRYKDWFSADTVKKGLILWYPGNVDGGTKIDYGKQVTYTANAEGDTDGGRIIKVYGYVNDEKITTICIGNEKEFCTKAYDLNESRLFIFCWQDDKKIEDNYLIGADENGKILYKKFIRRF